MTADEADALIASQQLRRLLKTVAPEIDPFDSLAGMVSQIDNYISGFIRGDKWDLAKWRKEYQKISDACETHIHKRNKLADALQDIALMGDTGSEKHWHEFGTGPGQPVANGWRVAERMRDRALEVVGPRCETCGGEGQVQLADEGGNRMWWPCPACR